MQNDDEITAYLRAHPQFFERNAHLLIELYLPSPHGSGTISLAERQQLAQRDKIRILEVKLAELIQFGEENDIISDKVHRLTLGILAAGNFDALMHTVARHLREDFQVPHAAIRLWAKPQDAGDADRAEFEEVDAALIARAQAMSAPYCGPMPETDLENWFDDVDAPLKSYALIPLRGEKTFGLLAMASTDPQRFYLEMDTLYLKRIGELISVALLRYPL
ncbi:MAG: DUF484 family protein [Methylobacillus sp.]|jgi:uncharacterized protein YigA (DUF484 family)|nr:DUF484 family protein [Methylobacillus sp.]